MSDSLLRRYAPEECGADGYPFAWHGGTEFYEPDGPVVLIPAIKDLIREQAGHRCLRCGHPYPPGIAETHPRGEWTPCDEQCTHGGPVRHSYDGGSRWTNQASVNVPGLIDLGADVEAHWRILTVHHLDEDKANCRWWNLAALCQRDHLRMQRAVIMGRPYHYEHSEWFKPFAAGFYAWKYEDVELSREETLARLEELLAYEHQFTQEVLL